MPPRARVALLVVLAALAAAPLARAQGGGPAARSPIDPTPLPPAPPEDVSPESPRASMGRFINLCRRGNYLEAAGYLDLPAATPPVRAVEQVRRLKAVLDRFVWIDLNDLSPGADGDIEDRSGGLAEEIGRIPGAGRDGDPVRLVRRQRPDGPRWVFSRGTVDHIDAWYARLGNRWVLEHLPEPLLRPGPRELLYWQWLALPLLLGLAWVVGVVLRKLVGRILRRITARTATRIDDMVVAGLGGPFTLAVALCACRLAVPLMHLYAPAEAFIHNLIGAAIYIAFFWALWRLVEVGREAVADSPWATEHPASHSLVPLGSRLLKLALLTLAVVAALAALGYPVGSLIAGLGIGGLALALAAQKTVENLFGTFSIGVDQPFRVGDYVSFDGVSGTVEQIGLRSTRIRTLDRTLVTMPNGKLSEMRIENFTARDRIRLAVTLGLVYQTREAQLREVLAGIERALREHPRLWSDTVIVRFKGFASSSLDIEVMAWFQTKEWNEFLAIREEILLRFMEVVEKAGTSFAFPTQTVHVQACSEARNA